LAIAINRAVLYKTKAERQLNKMTRTGSTCHSVHLAFMFVNAGNDKARIYTGLSPG